MTVRELIRKLSGFQRDLIVLRDSEQGASGLEEPRVIVGNDGQEYLYFGPPIETESEEDHK